MRNVKLERLQRIQQYKKAKYLGTQEVGFPAPASPRELLATLTIDLSLDRVPIFRSRCEAYRRTICWPAITRSQCKDVIGHALLQEYGCSFSEKSPCSGTERGLISHHPRLCNHHVHLDLNDVSHQASFKVGYLALVFCSGDLGSVKSDRTMKNLA